MPWLAPFGTPVCERVQEIHNVEIGDQGVGQFDEGLGQEVLFGHWCSFPRRLRAAGCCWFGRYLQDDHSIGTETEETVTGDRARFPEIEVHEGSGPLVELHILHLAQRGGRNCSADYTGERDDRKCVWNHLDEL